MPRVVSLRCFNLLRPTVPLDKVHQISLPSLISSNSCNFTIALSDSFSDPLGDALNFGNFNPLHVYFNPSLDPRPSLNAPIFSSGFSVSFNPFFATSFNNHDSRHPNVPSPSPPSHFCLSFDCDLSFCLM